MKSFIQHITEQGEGWMLPDYPEQVLAKDDPKGDWVTGDPPRPIDIFPHQKIHSMGSKDISRNDIRDTVKKTLAHANQIIRKEREAQKPK